MTATQEKPAKVTLADRTGACSVARCICSTFAEVRPISGWPSCSCTHTRHSHQPGATDA